MSSVTLDETVEQQAVSQSRAERTSEAMTSEVISSPADIPFDRVSRQRLLVAQSAADTIEQLGETGAWDRLEPVLAEHLLIQARRLEGYVTTLTEARPVRSSEPALLLLRRLQRRLSIAVELVEDEAQKAAAATPGGLFLGDFTQVEVGPTGDQPRTKKDSKGKAGKAEAKAKSAGATKWATKAERLAVMRQSKRVMTYLGVAALAVAGSLALRAVTTIQEHPVKATPPPVAFTPNEYLKESQGFLPATATAFMGNDLTVIVSKEWLLHAYEQRITDANGLSVFLMNRNVRRLRLQWEDGRPIVQFDNGTPTWFDEKSLDALTSARSR